MSLHGGISSVQVNSSLTSLDSQNAIEKKIEAIAKKLYYPASSKYIVRKVNSGARNCRSSQLAHLNLPLAWCHRPLNCECPEIEVSPGLLAEVREWAVRACDKMGIQQSSVFQVQGEFRRVFNPRGNNYHRHVETILSSYYSPIIKIC